ncbi:hypothetical protein [Nocardioides sp. SR21]|uniref:hypothetical protein n=1 Tax=Nocardioides sp. SR21 TaxID=2919501 RepID=UPI001FAAF860|nr:hypothetical protein [Nocardioides sp. SR21]
MISLGKSGRLAGRAIVYGVGGAATAVVGAGIVLTKFSKDAIGEAREAQKVGAVTRAEIKATGGVANVTERSMSRLAGAISEKVGMDDEAIQSGANLLLTFKNVRNETGKGNKIFNQATRAAVNLSAAGFGSIESGSKMLGKALNDPLKGITALSRAGVTFSEEQQKRIEHFVEENDLLAAQKIILGEVESQVGGVAAEQATWGDKAGVLWGNIQERFGTAILPLLDRAQRWFVQDGGPELDRWIAMFEDRGIPALERGVRFIQSDALPAIGDFVDDARPLAESIIPAIGSGLETAADAFKVIAPLAKDVFDGFNNLPDWAKSAIAITAGAGVVGKKAGLFDKTTMLGSIASKAKPLPVFVVNSGLDVPGRPGAPSGPGSVGGKVMRYGGVTTLGFGAVALGAEQMGSYLANRPLALPERRNGTYSPGATIKALPSQVVVPGIDPRTMMPTVNYNAASEGYDKLVDKISEGERFARRFGVTLEDANRIMGGEIPRSAMELRDWIGRAVDRTSDFTRQLLGGKAAGDELVGTLGVIAQDWQPKIRLDSLAVAELRLESFTSKLEQLGGTGDFPTTSPRVNPPRPPKRPQGSTPQTAGKTVAPASRQPTVVQLVMPNGRVLAETVIDDVDDQLARR